MNRIFTNFLVSVAISFSMLISVSLNAQCDAGTLMTTGSITVCLGGTFDAYSTGFDVPGGGTYAWVFRNNSTNGTGGVGSDVIIPGGVIQTFDADLGGLLSANNFPPLDGTWLLTGAVSTNVTAPGQSQCDETTEFLEVTFTSDFSSHNVTLSENGPDLASTVGGGTMPYTYEWSDGSIETFIADAIPSTIYCLTVTDASACHVTACQSFSEACEAGDLQTTGAITVCDGGTFDLMTSQEEIPLSGGYGWFISNEFTDGTGGVNAPIFLGLTETAVTYNNDLNGVLAANNLPPLVGTWAFFGSTYSSTADFNNTRCSNTTDSLLVTFVATPAPTVDIASPDPNTIITQVTGGMEPYTYEWSNGATTEGLDGITENGTYSLTVTDANGCRQTTSIDVFPMCDTGIFTTAGNICVAGSNTFEASVANPVLPDTGGFGWLLSNQNSDGTGGTEGPVFLDDFASSVTWDNDLGGILSNANFPPLVGTWVLFGVVFSDGTDFQTSLNSDCSITADSMVISFVAQELAATITDDNATLTAAATGGDGPYTYLWSSGEMAETITATETGTFTVTVTDSNGCETTAEVMVMISSTDQIEGLSEFAVSPNPSKGNFDLRLALETTENIQVRLVSVTGQIVKEIASEYSNGGIYHVEGEELSGGLYLLQVTIAGQTINEKVLITK